MWLDLVSRSAARRRSCSCTAGTRSIGGRISALSRVHLFTSPRRHAEQRRGAQEEDGEVHANGFCTRFAEVRGAAVRRPTSRTTCRLTVALSPCFRVVICMYSTCLFCHSDLGTNESIESFPIGRRLAFDAAQGRLWVVCRKCERWNLTPMEERWEAVEQCERLFTSTRLRVSSDNIGLSRLSEGLELVRIGKALRPEIAAWRYGDQFGRRRRRYMIGTAAVGVAAVGLVVAGRMTGLLAGGGYGLFQLLNGLQRAGRDRIIRARVAVPGRDRPAMLRGKDMKRIILATDGESWSLKIPGGGPKNRHVAGHREFTFEGKDALR